MISECLKKVLAGDNLSVDESTAVMNSIMQGDATDAQIAGLLIALKLKGEVSSEVAGFVTAMRAHSVKINVADRNAVDGCGTGGDGAHTFNISTAAAIVAAAAGVTVAKHGNRSVSSKCGSADILEAAGGEIDPGVDLVEKSINDIGFGFMFAPRFHPAMKYAGKPRRELGVRTVFNILGPMTNPAQVRRQVIGVFQKELLDLMAEVLLMTGSKHVLIAHSRDGLDEFSVSAQTDYVEVVNGTTTHHLLDPTDLGFELHKKDELAGGDASENLTIFKSLLDGKKSAVRDAVLLNAGALVYVGAKAESIKDGIESARSAIDSGAAKEKLDSWVKSTRI